MPARTSYTQGTPNWVDLQTTDQVPGVPNHWQVYFQVADPDAAVAKAAQLGGAVVVQPFDLPVGRLAVISDPQGACSAS